MTAYRPAPLLTLVAALLVGIALSACTPSVQPPAADPYISPEIAVVAEGLLAPVGLAALPDGSLLVAEEGTGQRDFSAGVSLITPDGDVGRLISGLQSSLDAGDLAGAPLVALAPDGGTLYVGNFGQGHLWTLPLTAEQQANGPALPATALSPDDLTPAMLPLNQVMLVNPFDLTFDAAGAPVVSDASSDGVAKPTADGATRFIHRFARLPNPQAGDPRATISPVPTGIARIGGEYYVTLTGGCPYPEGGGRLVAIDENRNERVVVDGLNMPIDVAQGPDGTIWLLEFARFAPDASCFSGSGYQARTGRLSIVQPDGSLRPVLEGLNFPGAVLPLPDGSLVISEVLPGRVVRVTWGEEGAAGRQGDKTRSRQEDGEAGAPVGDDIEGQEGVEERREVAVAAFDAVLRRAAAERGLRPRPGADQREGETALAALGQALFFDPILSGDRNISCSTCHHPLFAGADGRVLPIGAGGVGLGPERRFDEQVALADEASAPRRRAGVTGAAGETVVLNPFEGAFVPRNAPTILNSALFPRQFWDSRIETYTADEAIRTPDSQVNRLGLTDALATQALFPLASLHEMAGATLGGLAPQAIRDALLERLRTIPAYAVAFRAAFEDHDSPPDELITAPRLVAAIAAFERRLIFTDAPWDAYLAGDDGALSEQQKRGALLFFGQIDSAVDCSQCHSGDLFSDFQHHNLLVPQLGPGKGHGYTGREDWGRAGVTFDARDRYTFRTPSLRNVELTAPYFHSGAFATLEAAIAHHADVWGSAAGYDPVANAIPPALFSSLRQFQPEQQGRTVAPALAHGLPLNDDDLADLAAFLRALTDPRARDLSAFQPSETLSGLPLDPLPAPTRDPQATDPPAAAAHQSTDLPVYPSPPLPVLTDVAAEVGIDFRHGAFRTAVFQDPAAAMGGGLCWIDFDNDGWLDLYLVNSYAEEERAYWEAQGGLPRNRLYRNVEGRFVAVSDGSGADLALRGNGCVAADFDGDGWWDLYITADGANALLWNNGDGTFSEGAAAAGVAAPEWNSAAVVGDLNGDGWPDLFVAAYIDLKRQIPKPTGAFPQDYYGLPDRLYLNQGPAADGRVTFREVTAEAGLLHEERSLGALLSDLDQDGRLDLYIANDGHPNRLYANVPWPGGIEADPAGLGFRLQDITDAADVGDTGSGMGVAGGDWDGDGWIDLFITNWEHELNALYRSQVGATGELAFQYSTFRIGLSGLGSQMTGWGAHWIDLDHDGDLDLLVVNGRVPVTSLESDPQLVRFYQNRIGNGALDGPGLPRLFVEATAQVGLETLGPLLARGSAAADFDNDGDLDVAINQIGGPAVLLRNDLEQGNWLVVAPDGFQPGARAVAELPDGRRLLRQSYAGSSYLASEDPRLHFGLGDAARVVRLTITLPDGRQMELRDVAANQIIAPVIDGTSALTTP